jgi:hypothetical protein
MRRNRQDLAAQLARLTALLAVEVRHRLYARRPVRLAGDSDRRESAIAGEVLEEAAPGIGAILAAAIHMLERRIAARNRAKGDKPAANGGGGAFT